MSLMSFPRQNVSIRQLEGTLDVKVAPPSPPKKHCVGVKIYLEYELFTQRRSAIIHT